MEVAKLRRFAAALSSFHHNQLACHAALCNFRQSFEK
jgi:hypothetical protein